MNYVGWPGEVDSAQLHSGTSVCHACWHSHQHQWHKTCHL